MLINAASANTLSTDVQSSSEVLPAFCAESQRLLVARWCAWLQEQVALAQLAPGSADTYQRGAKRWLAFLEIVERTDAPRPATVSRFIAASIPGRRPATVNVLIAGVRSLFRYSESVGSHEDIARSARPIRVDNRGPLAALDRDAVGKLVALITGDDLRSLRDRALVLCLFGTGVRTVSLERATVGDFDAVTGTLLHRPKAHRSADALAYVPAGAAKAMVEYLNERQKRKAYAPGAPLFINLCNHSIGAVLPTRSIRRIILALQEEAGNARRGVDGRLLSPGVWSCHSLRRSALKAVAEAHGIEAAARMAGHLSSVTTQRYYHRMVMDDQLRAAASTLDLTSTRT